MCFAINRGFQLECYTVGNEVDIDHWDFAVESIAKATVAAPMTRKRATSTVLEHFPRKSVKTSTEDTASHGHAASGIVQAESRDVLEADGMTDITKSLEDARLKIKKLTGDLTKSDEELQDWRMRAVNWEDAYNELHRKFAAYKNAKPFTREGSKRLEDTIRQDFQAKADKKVAEMQKKLDKVKEQNRQALVARDTKHKDIIHSEKESQKTKDKAHKDQVAELKASHKAEVARLGPGYDNLVKEKNLLEKKKDIAIEAFEKRVDDLEAREDALKQTVEDIEQQLKASQRKNVVKEQQLDETKRILNQHLQDWQKMVNLKGTLEAQVIESKEELATMEAKEKEYQARLVHEGKRWQIQFERANTFEKERIELRRSDTALRESIERRDHHGKAMAIEIRRLKRRLEELEAGKVHVQTALEDGAATQLTDDVQMPVVVDGQMDVPGQSQIVI